MLVGMKNTSSEAGEMARWLGAPAALKEDQVQFPAPTWYFTTIRNSSSRRPSALFWPDLASNASDVQTHAGQTLIYMKVRVIF